MFVTEIHQIPVDLLKIPNRELHRQHKSRKRRQARSTAHTNNRGAHDFAAIKRQTRQRIHINEIIKYNRFYTSNGIESDRQQPTTQITSNTRKYREMLERITGN